MYDQVPTYFLPSRQASMLALHKNHASPTESLRLTHLVHSPGPREDKEGRGGGVEVGG